MTTSFSQLSLMEVGDLSECPRRFSGDKDVLDFIEDVELYMAVKRVPFDNATYQIDRLLQSHALGYWQCLRDPVHSWEEAKAKLIKVFSPESLHNLMSDLLACRQQPNERSIDYITKISSIMRKMKPPLHDSLQVGFIISGLKPSIARHMIGKENLSPLQLSSEIIQVEADLKRLSKKQ